MADLSGLILTVLGLSFNVASTLYTYSQNVKAASDGIPRLSTELFALIGILEHVKLQRQRAVPASSAQSLGVGSTESLRKVLEDTLGFLPKLKAALDPPQGRFKSAVQKLKWPLKEKETSSYLQQLERVKTYLILSQVTDDIDRTQDIALQIAELSTLVEEHRFEQKTEDVAGAGKTTLMTTAIDAVRVEVPEAHLASFYCSFTERESLEESTILGSFLSQLYRSLELNIKKIEPLYQASQPESTSQVRRLDTQQLLDLLLESIGDHRTIYIFIDGIKECTNPESILISLGKLIQSCSNTSIHLFISSINEKGIEPCIEKLPELRVESLRERNLREDIHLLVKATLESNARLRTHNAQLKADIEQALTRGAHGMFRWVQCQLDSLSRLRTPGAVREALERLPPTLDKTYEGLLDRIDDGEDKSLARDILETLAFAYRPLRLQEVCEMLQVTPGLSTLDESRCLADPKDVLGICGNLLTYEKDTGLVALAHHSVKTYLTSDLQGRSSYFRLIRSSAHKNIAEKCLTYLSYDVFSSGPCLPVTRLEDRYERFPLLDYAAQCWPFHVRKLGSLDDSTWKTLKGFFASADEGRGNFHAYIQLLMPSSNPSDIFRTPPLYYAASYGLTEVVKYLLDAGADIEVHGGRSGATPLNIACYRNHYDVAKLLFDHGADPHAADRTPGCSAIQWARRYGHTKIYKLLTNSEDEIGNLPPIDHEAACLELLSRQQQWEKEWVLVPTISKVAISPSWSTTTEKRQQWWNVIAVAESQSDHPVAKAIVEFARQYVRLRQTATMKGSLQHFDNIEGRGIVASVASPDSHRKLSTVLIGNVELLSENGIKLPHDGDNHLTRTLRPGLTLAEVYEHNPQVFVAIDSEFAGTLTLVYTPLAVKGASDDEAASEPTNTALGHEMATEWQELELQGPQAEEAVGKAW